MMDSSQTRAGQEKSRSNASQTVPRLKSPAPTFINLDDCKPILSTTAANTSTNSSNRGTTAFVFTSSRTLRALQDQEDRRLSPSSPALSSPATPPTPSEASSSSSRHRALLTLSQLTKHSEGAIDARALIGPKMRAAGFVNLPHAFGSRSDLGISGGHSSSSQTFPVSSHFPPTPNDPPIFPPILFLNPSTAATLPWEYQREAPWSFPSTSREVALSGRASPGTASNEPTPGAAQAESPLSRPPPVPHPRRADASGLSSSDSSGLMSSSGSSSTLFSPESSPSTGLSSVDEDDEEAPEVSHKGKARAKENEPSEFPFPPAYDHPHSPKSVRSHGSRASSATASPTIYAGPAPTRTTSSFSSVSFATVSPPTHRQDIRSTKPPPPPHPPPKAELRRDKPPITENRKVAATPSFATARPSKPQRQYSLTELCDSSPFAWLTKSDIFVPPAPIARSPIRASSLAPSSLFISASRPRPPVEPPPHRRHLTAPDTVPTLSTTVERHHRIPSAPLRLTTIPSERAAAPSDQGSGKTKSSRGTKHDVAGPSVKVPSHMGADGAEIHRWSDGVAASDPHSRTQDPSGVAAGNGTVPRVRGRDTRGKALAASETAEKRAAAEETEYELEKARQGLTELVLAHRERDREYARHVATDRERDRLVKQKQRAHRKLRDYAPSESESTMVDQLFTDVKSVG